MISIMIKDLLVFVIDDKQVDYQVFQYLLILQVKKEAK
jgi:hypothetical protein